MPLQLTSPAACQIIGEPDNAYLMKRPDATERVSLGPPKGNAFFISGRSVFRSQTFIAVDQSDSWDSGVQQLVNRRLILVKALANIDALKEGKLDPTISCPKLHEFAEFDTEILNYLQASKKVVQRRFEPRFKFS